MVNVSDDAYVVWQQPMHVFRAIEVKIIVSKDVYKSKTQTIPSRLIIAIDKDNNLYSNAEVYDEEFFDSEGRSVKIKALTHIRCSFYTKGELMALIKNTKRVNEGIIRSMETENASLSVIAKKFNLE